MVIAANVTCVTLHSFLTTLTVTAPFLVALGAFRVPVPPRRPMRSAARMGMPPPSPAGLPAREPICQPPNLGAAGSEVGRPAPLELGRLAADTLYGLLSFRQKRPRSGRRLSRVRGAP